MLTFSTLLQSLHSRYHRAFNAREPIWSTAGDVTKAALAAAVFPATWPSGAKKEAC